MLFLYKIDNLIKNVEYCKYLNASILKISTSNGRKSTLTLRSGHW